MLPMHQLWETLHVPNSVPSEMTTWLPVAGCQVVDVIFVTLVTTNATSTWHLTPGVLLYLFLAVVIINIMSHNARLYKDLAA